ncbi:MAG: substrate-binding domain-containing protein [Synechococcales bacterium]|nr:substrate-binding domain-containing protein [Synechococcales bacterium]
MTSKKNPTKRDRILTSSAILAASLGLAYAPLPGSQRTIVIISGSELQEPLQILEAKFEQQNPNIQVEFKFQGSQDIANQFLNQTQNFKPTVIIPANAETISEIQDRWLAGNKENPFDGEPNAIAKTRLVAVSWGDRGKALFPDGQFRWERLEQAMQKQNWGAIATQHSNWGSFDFVMTDPARSNSGQLILGLWAQTKLGQPLTYDSVNQPKIQQLFQLVKRSVYQPKRSSDDMLKEFIAQGANQGDVAIAYESNALYRLQQSAKNQINPYQIYYLDQTVETVSTAAVLKQGDWATADAAKQFVNFLTQPEQQKVFVQYGFRPVNPQVDLQTVPNSPWNQNLPGVQLNPPGQVLTSPNWETQIEVVRQWERS